MVWKHVTILANLPLPAVLEIRPLDVAINAWNSPKDTFFEMHGIPPMWAVRGAIDMCHQHPPGVSKVNAADAAPGDLYVMSIPNDSFGHVAVVTGIDRSKGVVHVVEQNWSNTGVNTHPLSSAACFLRGGK